MILGYHKALLGLALLAVIGFFIGLQLDVLWLRLLCKPVPLLVLIVCVLSWSRDRYAVSISMGLVLSLLGDVLLEIPANLFLLGLVSFLLAHLCYIFAFWSRSRLLRIPRAFPFFLWCGAMFFWMAPGLGKLLIPVAVYVLVISTMLWRAAAIDLTEWSGKTALMGAISFALSDSFLAVNRFVEAFDGARELIISTYWLGQLGIAFSVCAICLERNKEDPAA